MKLFISLNEKVNGREFKSASMQKVQMIKKRRAGEQIEDDLLNVAVTREPLVQREESVLDDGLGVYLGETTPAANTASTSTASAFSGGTLGWIAGGVAALAGAAAAAGSGGSGGSGDSGSSSNATKNSGTSSTEVLPVARMANAEVTGETQLFVSTVAETVDAAAQLEIKDADAGEARFQARAYQGRFGSVSVSEDGVWTYAPDASIQEVRDLAEGATLSDIVTIVTADGTEQDLEITLTCPDVIADVLSVVAGVAANYSENLNEVIGDTQVTWAQVVEAVQAQIPTEEASLNDVVTAFETNLDAMIADTETSWADVVAAIKADIPKYEASLAEVVAAFENNMDDVTNAETTSWAQVVKSVQAALPDYQTWLNAVVTAFNKDLADEDGTVWAGGTPFFDEATGEYVIPNAEDIANAIIGEENSGKPILGSNVTWTQLIEAVQTGAAIYEGDLSTLATALVGENTLVKSITNLVTDVIAAGELDVESLVNTLSASVDTTGTVANSDVTWTQVLEVLQVALDAYTMDVPALIATFTDADKSAALQTAFTDIGDALSSELPTEKQWQDFVSKLSDSWEAVADDAQTSWDDVVAAVQVQLPTIEADWEELVSNLTNNLGSATTDAQTTWTDLVDTLEAALPDSEDVTQFVTDLKANLSDTSDSAQTLVDDVVAAVVTALPTVDWEELATNLTDDLSSVSTGAQTAWTDVVDAVQAALPDSEEFTQIVTDLQTSLSSTTDATQTLVDDLVTAVQEVLPTVDWEELAANLTDDLSSVTTDAQVAWTDVIETLEVALPDDAQISQLITDLQNSLNNTTDATTTTVNDTVTDVVSSINNVVDTASTQIEELAQQWQTWVNTRWS